MNKPYKTIKIEGKRVLEHRYIMELNIGRKLNKDEIIHHIDKDERNNVIENLLLTTKAEHARTHAKDKIGKRFKFRTIGTYSYVYV